MGKVQWSDAMRVGVVEIDDQHEGLTTVINTLYDAYMNGDEHAVLADLIRQINTYAQVHFATERRYMAPYVADMPNYEEHMRQHREFFSDCVSFLLEYMDRGTGITPELLDYLTDWWFKHINGTDRVMAAVLKQHGVS